MVLTPLEVDNGPLTGRLFEALTHAAPGCVWLGHGRGQVVFVNQNWMQYTGLSMTESLGDGWLGALHPTDVKKIRKQWALPTKAAGASARRTKIRLRRLDGSYRWHSIKIHPVGGSDGYWIVSSVEIHEQVVAQQKDSDQVAILNMVASDAPVQAALEALCRLGEEQLPGCKCSVLTLNKNGTEFAEGAAAFLPQHLKAILHGTKIGPYVGSCGTAAFERRDVVSADIRTDPLWADWRKLFEPLGIRACWSRPVYGADGNVLAVYGFYFFEVRVPSREELTSLENLRHLASVAIGKARIAQALRESEQHYRHTVEYNPQIPWTADATGKILSVSSRWTEATGLSVESALGTGWIKALHPDDVRQTLAYWAEKLSSGDTTDCKYRIRLRDGSFRWVRSRATPRRDSQGMIIRWYGAAEDIHELELATERLRRQAYFDDVSRLLNRRGLENALRERLENAALRNRPVSLLIVNINGFRHVNDRYGHHTGDAVLRFFGTHLGRCQGSRDIVARIAGDEFAIVIDHANDNPPLLKRASKIAAEMNRRLTRSAKIRGCSTSIGCAVSELNERAEDLIRRANLALYAAKRDAHDAVKIYTPAIRRVEDERIGQTELAKQALRQRWIVPYYQPIVSLTTGEVVGAEALLRIARPMGDILSPAAIWAAFETFKVSRLIDGRMLSLALSDFSRWKLCADQMRTVSINLSTEMLLQDGLARSILRKMERRGVLPQQVTIEITERVLIDNLAPNTHRALSDLQRHGVRVSLDDFGTGFASLTHLQKLPVNEIKIDRSFVKALQINGPNAAIVKSMISLGLNIGVDVVAEGVETAQQATLLQDWGCPFAQGFHFFKPMPADAFGKLLKHAGERSVERSRKTIQPGLDRHHSL